MVLQDEDPHVKHALDAPTMEQIDEVSVKYSYRRYLRGYM